MTAVGLVVEYEYAGPMSGSLVRAAAAGQAHALMKLKEAALAYASETLVEVAIRQRLPQSRPILSMRVTAAGKQALLQRTGSVMMKVTVGDAPAQGDSGELAKDALAYFNDEYFPTSTTSRTSMTEGYS